MDEAMKKLIPKGVVRRICKSVIQAKECQMSPEYTDALNKYVCKLMEDITTDTCEIALANNKKKITLGHMKVVGEKRGILFE